MDAGQENHLTLADIDPSSLPGNSYEGLADRLREVRRQLSRREPLAGAFERHHASAAALRAAQRLECAVRRLGEGDTVRRLAHKGEDGLPWLVRVIERRADMLETILKAQRPGDDAAGINNA